MTAGIEAAQMQAELAKLAEGGGALSQTPAELADKFQSLMQRAQLAPPSDPGSSHGVEAASKMLRQQDVELERISADADAFNASAANMSMQQLSAAGMRLMMEMSTAQIDLQAKMGVVESSKTSIETLMRNQ
ncbi:type III secretion protein HrpB2 [Trinickia acidisoli]|uniref:type III secretion protein HrpB2 n=1 Tax=Trinickia acidisoli TaxID=2767482 RepID=UPI001A8FB4C8|nr:type III secretion protein HrpB2 [Trinickia acidisoli]